MAGPSARAYHVALLVGLPVAVASASTCVAFHFQWAPWLGRPLWGHLYDPRAVLGWAWAWGLSPAYRLDFLAGLSLAVGLGMLPAFSLRIWERFDPPLPPEREAGSRLGGAAELIALGTFAHHGPGIAVGLDGRRPLFEVGESHALVLGPTRSGKGVNNIVPTLLTWTHSALVFDFKGELASVCGPMRAHLGRVFTVDPTSLRSARLNPLLSLRTGPEMVTDAQALAQMLVDADGHDGGEQIWAEASALVVTALLIAARLSPEPTLGTFWRMLNDLMAKRAIACPEPWAAEVLDQAWRTWPEKTRGSVFFNLAARLAFLGSPLVQAVVSGDDFRAEDLVCGPVPVTVFVGTPLDMADAMRPLHRLLLAALLRPLTVRLHETPDGRRKERKLLMLLDEFPALGRIPAMEANMANLAGYGVRAMLCAQDEEQVVRVYGDHHALSANCRLRIYSASLSQRSLHRERELAGTEMVLRRGSSRAGTGFGRVSRSVTETSAPLVESGELMNLALSHVVVFAPGLRRPVVLKKMRYYEHRFFRGLFAAPDGPRFGLWPADRALPTPAVPVPATAVQAPPAGTSLLPPVGTLTLTLTPEQVEALRRKAKPGETPAAFLARIIGRLAGPGTPP